MASSVSVEWDLCIISEKGKRLGRGKKKCVNSETDQGGGSEKRVTFSPAVQVFDWGAQDRLYGSIRFLALDGGQDQGKDRLMMSPASSPFCQGQVDLARQRDGTLGVADENSGPG